MNRFLAVLLLFPALCLGQTPGAHRLGQVLVKGNNVEANVGPYANIKVCVLNTSCNSLATIYTGPSMTVQMSQPVIADGNGNYSYFVPVGCVDEMISTPGQGQIFVPNVCPFNGQAGGGGGGANPAGDINELNAKQSTSAFQGSGMFTNTPHTYLFTPAPQYAHFAVNSPTSSYAGGRATGSLDIYGQNSVVLGAGGVANGFGQAFYRYHSGLFTGLSFYNGNPTSAQPAGGSVLKLENNIANFHSTGITQLRSDVTTCGKVGDCANDYAYFYAHGGYRYGADEGSNSFARNGGNQASRVAGAQVVGNPGTGATTLNLTNIAHADDWLTEGFVYNQTAGPSNTGNVTDLDGASGFMTVTPGSVTPATATGTTLGDVTIVAMSIAGTQLSVNVHVDSGSAFPASGLVIFGCNVPDVEFVNATATPKDGSGNQTLTATFLHGHPTGCKVATPEGSGIMDFVVDRISNNWITSYFVFGAPDNSHTNLRTYRKGILGTVNAWKQSTKAIVVSNANVRRLSNQIVICNLGQNEYTFGGVWVQVSGAADTTLNGIYQTGQLNVSYCVTAANSGADTSSMTATATTGGAVNGPLGVATQPGSGAFAIWPAAMIKQVGTVATTVSGATTLGYNNQLTLYPNNLTFTNNQYVIGTDDMQMKLEAKILQQFDVPASPDLQQALIVGVSGQGVAGFSYRTMTLTNSNAFCMYKGGNVNVNPACPGLLDGPIGLNIGGPFADTMRINAPLPNGSAIEITETSATDSNLGNNSHFTIRDNGPGGNAGFYIRYDPNAGRTDIASGTGNGVVSAITLLPNSIALSSTGAFTFGGSGYTFSGLGGSTNSPFCANINGLTGAFTRSSVPCGTVTSVGITPPAWASVGSPVTGSGNVTLTLPAFKASGATHAPGVVPDPGASAGTTRVLYEDGTWRNTTTSGFSGTFKTGDTPTPKTCTVLNGLITGCS